MCSKTGVSAPPCRSQDTVHKEGNITEQRHTSGFAVILVQHTTDPARTCPVSARCPTVATHALPFPFTVFLSLIEISPYHTGEESRLALF